MPTEPATALISNDIVGLGLIAATLALIFWAASGPTPLLKKIFAWVPALLLCYFIPAIYNTCFDDCQFTRIFQGRTRDERLALLRDEKIVYLFCSWSHLARYRSPGNYGYTSDYPTRELVHLDLVAKQKLLEIIEIETEPTAGELFRVTTPDSAAGSTR